MFVQRAFIFLLFFVVMLHASDHAKKDDLPPITIKEGDVPPVLYPLDRLDHDAAFIASVYYLGGYAGNTSSRVASGGAYQTRSPNQPSSGKPVFAELKWCNGALVEFLFDVKGRSGHSVGFSYDFLSSMASHYETHKQGNYLPTFASDNFSTFTIQNQASSFYELFWFQEGRIWYNRGPIFYPQNAVLSLEPICGIQIVNIHQRLSIRYHDNSTNLTRLTLSETDYGGGPLVGAFHRLLLGGGFALRGALVASIPIMHEQIKQSDSYIPNDGSPTIYGLSTKGHFIRPAFGFNIDLDILYHYDWKHVGIEVAAGWFMEQYLGISSIMQAANNQGMQPGAFGVNSVKIGVNLLL